MKEVVLYQKTEDIKYDMSQTKKKTKIELIPEKFSVCKVTDYSGIDIDQPFVFTGRTDEEKTWYVRRGSFRIIRKEGKTNGVDS